MISRGLIIICYQRTVCGWLSVITKPLLVVPVPYLSYKLVLSNSTKRAIFLT